MRHLILSVLLLSSGALAQLNNPACVTAQCAGVMLGGTAMVGSPAYIDSTARRIETLPSALSGSEYLMTMHQDRNDSDASTFLSVGVQGIMDLYFAYARDSSPVPQWVQSHPVTGDTMSIGSREFDLRGPIRAQDRTVTLGGNGLSNSRRMYLVFGVRRSPPPPPAPPPPPQGEVTLRWTPPSTNVDGAPAVVEGYRIYWGRTRGGPYDLSAVADGPPSTLTGFADGAWYFVVTAFNSAGESAWSNEAVRTFSGGRLVVPNPPQSLQ